MWWTGQSLARHVSNEGSQKAKSESYASCYKQTNNEDAFASQEHAREDLSDYLKC